MASWEGGTWSPFASEISAVDASTRDRLGTDVPWVRTRAAGNPDGLGGPIRGVFHLRVHQWARLQWWPHARDHGTAHITTLVKTVSSGVVWLLDRGSLRVSFFALLTQRGIWWMSRSDTHVRSQLRQVCSQADGVLDAVVSPGTYGSTQRARHPGRLVPSWLHGRPPRSLTNVLDPRGLPPVAVGKWYARRWESERAFRALKAHLTPHPLWRSTPAVIQVPP